MLPKDYISPSQIRQYLQCPFCYSMKYIHGVWQPRNQYLVRGKAVHAAIDHNYNQKIETHEDLPVDEVKEMAAFHFDEEKEGAEFDDDEGEVLDSTVTLSELYHLEVAPMVQPIQTEQKVEVAFEGLDYTLMGIIDLLDSEGVIHDTKTAKRTPNESVINDNLQLMAYGLMHETLHGTLPDIQLDYVVATKTPKVVQFRRSITQEDTTYFLKLMETVVKGIENEIFFPADNCWSCGTPKGYYYDFRKEYV